MNKYVLMLAAAALISAAPAYYAFQAQAEDSVASPAAASAQGDGSQQQQGAQETSPQTQEPAAGDAVMTPAQDETQQAPAKAE